MSSTKTTPRAAEAVDDQLVVDDLVVAVHGRLEGPHHPRQRLDRHLHAGAEAPGRGEQHPVDGHRGPALPGCRVSRGPARILGRCPLPESSLSRPDRRPSGPACGRATRSCAINGQVPRDVIEWQLLADEADSTLEVDRGGLELTVEVAKRAGEPLGVEVHSALFDQVRTCDNHCEFCFIYQLPPGPAEEPLPEGRRLPAVVPLRELHHPHPLHRGRPRAGRHRAAEPAEREHPRHRSRACAPACCATGAAPPSLRWLRALLDHGIEVHGQVVVCPGLNDGAVLDDTLAGVLDRYPELASLCVVPLGVSRYIDRGRACARTPRPRRPPWSTASRTGRTCSCGCSAAGSCSRPTSTTCSPAGRSRPAEAYEGFPMHEDGIGMARTFELEMHGAGRRADRASRRASSPGSTARPAEGYRAPRVVRRRRTRLARRCGRRRDAPGRASSPASTARGCSTPLVDRARPRRRARRAGAQRVLRRQHRRRRPAGRGGPRPRARRRARGPPLPAARRVPLGGPFLDGTTPADLPARSRSSPPTASRCARAACRSAPARVPA